MKIKNPIVEMRIFFLDEEAIVKSLKKNKFKAIDVEHGAPEPVIRFSGKYAKVETWCEDFLGEFNHDEIESMIIDGISYEMDEVEQDDDGNWCVREN